MMPKKIRHVGIVVKDLERAVGMGPYSHIGSLIDRIGLVINFPVYSASKYPLQFP